MLPPPQSTLFPYTTLFRSRLGIGEDSRDPRRCERQLGKPLRVGRPRDDVDALAVELVHDGLDARALQSDRKSTRLNSSHVSISYAVFCLKKKIEKLHVKQL